MEGVGNWVFENYPWVMGGALILGLLGAAGYTYKKFYIDYPAELERASTREREHPF